MARSRMIARTLGSSEKFAALGREAGALGEFAQALYPLLVVCADDWGRMKAGPDSVHWVAWPSSTRTAAEFDQALQAMATVGLIQLYEPNGERLLEVVAFEDHQVGLHKRTPSQFPKPPEVPGNSGKVPLARARGTEQNRTEQKGTEGKAPRAPVATGPHKRHAFCGRVCVPASLHDELRRRLGTPDADATLRTWYGRMDDAWQPEQHPEALDEPFAFWKARFAECWPPPGKAPPADSARRGVDHWYDACHHEPPCGRLIDHQLREAQERDDVTPAGV